MTYPSSIVPYTKDELNSTVKLILSQQDTEAITKDGITHIKRTEAHKAQLITDMMMGYYGRKLKGLEDLPF